MTEIYRSFQGASSFKRGVIEKPIAHAKYLKDVPCNWTVAAIIHRCENTVGPV